MPTLAVAALAVAVAGPSYALWARRRLRRSPGVFACRLRPVGPLVAGRWARQRRHARWVHDVLLVHRGMTLRRCVALPAAAVTGPTAGMAVRGLGERAVGLRLLLDDGRLFDVAVSEGDAAVATGPFAWRRPATPARGPWPDGPPPTGGARRACGRSTGRGS